MIQLSLGFWYSRANTDKNKLKVLSFLNMSLRSQLFWDVMLCHSAYGSQWCEGHVAVNFKVEAVQEQRNSTDVQSSSPIMHIPELLTLDNDSTTILKNTGKRLTRQHSFTYQKTVADPGNF